MKIFTTSQIRELDLQTIEREPISSLALMERAADRMLRRFKKDFGFGTEVLIIAGPGNNGGDGLALGRMLLQIGYEVQVVLIHKGKLSPDCRQNKERLQELFPEFFSEQKDSFTPPEITAQTLIVDALFGSGISRPLEGIFRDAVKWLNSIENRVLSVDIPSGLHGETCASEDDVIVQADSTYTLQFPKLAFLFSENEKFIGDWKVVDIQLDAKAIEEMPTRYNLIETAEIKNILKKRNRFSHKGTFGHALIWAGKKGMAGAALLASQAALRAGVGLASVHSGEENRLIIQTAVPEAIFVKKLNTLDDYNAFAFGPGLGTEKETAEMLFELLTNLNCPCVLDADALNIISKSQKNLDIISANTILTPHPKEFDRLFGLSSNSCERIEKASAKAQELNVIIVLKGANTLVALPDGTHYFNSTGNPGMAVGGMGDVLAGIIVGLLAQNYTPKESALLGVFLHGLAGDLALSEQSHESLLPRDVIEKLGAAFNFLRER